MVTKDKIDEGISKLIERIRYRIKSSMAPTFFPVLSRKFNDLLDQSIKLSQELSAINGNSNGLYDIQKKLYQLEGKYRATKTLFILLPSIFFLYTGACVIFLLLKFVDITGFLKSTLEIEAPNKLIVIGILGAIIYLVTSGISVVESKNDHDRQFFSLVNVSLRFFLAVIVPVVLVSLFFNTNGGFKEFKLTPEVLSFCCGYSAKLVIDFLNKIVEKTSKIIQAI